jgi:hypothetical protein
MSKRLWTIGAILAPLWLISAVGPAPGGGHLILAIVTVLFVVRLLMLDPEFAWA